jgi:multiple sugar transport system substrate-binding protein
VPIYNYPWAVFYRKSVFKAHGYTVPKTWDQFIALAKKMQADGLTPIAFTDKDGWPPMGTFDILNLRRLCAIIPRRAAKP